jgi:hypothetical protein
MGLLRRHQSVCPISEPSIDVFNLRKSGFRFKKYQNYENLDAVSRQSIAGDFRLRDPLADRSSFFFLLSAFENRQLKGRRSGNIVNQTVPLNA